jgi:hypothetical protein
VRPFVESIVGWRFNPQRNRGLLRRTRWDDGVSLEMLFPADVGILSQPWPLVVLLFLAKLGLAPKGRGRSFDRF